MSMRDYAYNDYGLVLDEDTMKYMYAKAVGEQEADLYDMGYALYEKGMCEYTGEFTGEASFIDDDGDDDWRISESYSCDAIYYVPIRKYPSLFQAPYSNIDEIVEEFKSKVGAYMPDGYDYRANIRHIVGTVFG